MSSKKHKINGINFWMFVGEFNSLFMFDQIFPKTWKDKNTLRFCNIHYICPRLCPWNDWMRSERVNNIQEKWKCCHAIVSSSLLSIENKNVKIPFNKISRYYAHVARKCGSFTVLLLLIISSNRQEWGSFSMCKQPSTYYRTFFATLNSNSKCF